VEYLGKIRELAKKHSIKVIVLPPPMRASSKQSIDDMNKNEIALNNLGDEFKDYFQNIIYLNDDLFEDEVHLRNPRQYTEHYKSNFIVTPAGK
jgi:hypothetical protein